MATLTIRNVEDTIPERLRVRAATHGHSMEDEVRLILKQALGGITGKGLVDLSRQLFSGEQGVELDCPAVKAHAQCRISVTMTLTQNECARYQLGLRTNEACSVPRFKLAGWK